MKKLRYRRVACMVLLASLLSLIILPTALATSPGEHSNQGASISFANPGAIQTVVGEGTDFATDVLGNAWDMDQRYDVGFEVGFNNVSASNGIWQGTFSGVDQASGAPTTGYLFPLFQGFSTPINSQLSQELNWDVTGAHDAYTIDTSKYTLLSFRMYTSARTQYYVQWTGTKPVWWPNGDHRFGGNDGCYTGCELIYWPAGWRTYVFDLTQLNGEDPVRAGTWQDNPVVRGLRFDPSASAPVGTQVKVDWIRLTDPSTSPSINLRWNTVDASAGDTVDIYVADNPTGQNATSPSIRAIPVENGSYQFKTSVLPAGQYYFQLRLMSGDPVSNNCGVTKASSQWVGPLVINGAPTVRINSPSMTNGADYATTELGNPWDMNDASDIIYRPPPYPVTQVDETFQNGIYSARAIIVPGNPQSDSQILLHTEANRPIDTTRYRYLSVRMKVDTPAGRDGNWLIKTGWGSRAVWWNSLIETDGSETKYGALHEGWQTYTIDLARAAPNPSCTTPDNILTPPEQNPFPAQHGWTQLGHVQNLRFDPLETTPEALNTGADRFSIDWIKLTSVDRADVVFDIHWEVYDPNGDDVTVNVYAVPVEGTSAAGRQLLATVLPNGEKVYATSQSAAPDSAASVGQYKVYLPVVLKSHVPLPPCEDGCLRWYPTANGTYYIEIEAEDEYNEVHWYSESPVIIEK
ncbi:MAG: hypothetical protein KKA73_00850 [Chloroflexi bacterium]|nr:hypothetical protein [Chloroflexota bacterium]MBU1746211.1 hypothetical protein [Chloroflexota bacterium]